MVPPQTFPDKIRKDKCWDKTKIACFHQNPEKIPVDGLTRTFGGVFVGDSQGISVFITKYFDKRNVHGVFRCLLQSILTKEMFTGYFGV